MMLFDMVRFTELALFKLRMGLINSSYEYYNVCVFICYLALLWFADVRSDTHTHTHTRGGGRGEIPNHQYLECTHRIQPHCTVLFQVHSWL